MAIYVQPYPTMTDLKSQWHGFGGLGSLFDPVLAKAREMGLPLPPADIAPAEQGVYKILVGLATTEANLRQTRRGLDSLLAEGMPIPCKMFLNYNKGTDDFLNLAAGVVSRMELAGLWPKGKPLPQIPQKFEINQRCVVNPDAIVGGGLGVVGVDDVIIATAILVLAIGAAGSLLLLAKRWSDSDIQVALAQSEVSTNVTKLGLRQVEVLNLAREQCKDDKACVAKVAATIPDNTVALEALAGKLKVPEPSSHGLIWWIGALGLVGLAGAGIYAYKTNKKG